MGRGLTWAACGATAMAVVYAVLGATTSTAVESPRAGEITERALQHMGGETALRGIERAHLDMMTQWQRTTFRTVPGSDLPSFEAHTDVRDYTIPAWRNTRRFPGRNVINVIRDSVATTDFGTGVQPLSVAYVDERDELFVYSPDRLMLLLADAPDVVQTADTIVAGEPFVVLKATLAGRLPSTVLFHKGTGLPTMLRFRAAHPNDFGLSPWGAMAVEVWYSNWRTFGSITIPSQWDVHRMGRPYKRLTVQRADFAPRFEPADSFPVSNALRQRFASEASQPMHDRPIDSVVVRAPGLIEISGFGFPAGAVDTGSGWLLLGAGHMPLNLERARAALATHGATRFVGALAVSTRAGDGGAVTLTNEGTPVWVAPAAASLVGHVLANGGGLPEGIEVVSAGMWLGSGDQRVRLEPVDLPEAPGSLMLWAPALGWLYSPDAAQPLDVRLVEERARALGWDWTALGTARGLLVEGALKPYP